MSQNPALKYPHTYKSILSSQKEKAQSPESFLSLLQNRTTHYWPDSGVKSDIFHTRFPDIDKLIHMADLATRHRILYWHPWHMEVTHKTYRLGKKIDWFSSPTGDHEWIDSLVRFTHMIDLAAAYELTHEKKYLISFENYIDSFSKARNTPGRHWKFLINVAVRLINLIRAYDLISHVDSLPLPVHLKVLENITIDIEFLLDSLDKVRSNGAFFATTALLIASEFLQDLFYVGEWRTLAEKKLYQVLQTEIQPDWIEVEQVPMYHGQVILALLDYCITLNSNDHQVNPLLQKTIKNMLDALAGLCDPQGNIPAIGDSDRYSMSYIVDFYSVVFKTDTIQNTHNSITALPRTDTEYCTLTSYNASDWVIAHWDYSQDKQGYLLFDCSGKPKNQKSGHSHADDLQFLLHTTDGAVFIDPGRFTYCTNFKAYFPFTRKRIYPNGRFKHIYSLLFPNFMDLYSRNWREYFKRTLAHNTISLEGGSQPGYANRKEARSLTKLIQKKSIGPLVLLQGSLNTSNSLRHVNISPQSSCSATYQHQRTILGILPHLWLIVDHVQAQQEYNWISSYHLDTGGEASFRDKYLILKTNGGLHSMHFMSSSATTHSVSIDDDWVSHIYNKKSPSKTIRATIQKSSDAVLVTAIHSLDNNLMHIDGSKTCKISTDNNSLEKDIFQLTLSNDNSVTQVIINPDCETLKFKGLESNAMLSFESRNGQQLTEAGFIGGTFLRSQDFSLACSTGDHGVHRKF